MAEIDRPKPGNWTEPVPPRPERFAERYSMWKLAGVAALFFVFLIGGPLLDVLAWILGIALFLVLLAALIVFADHTLRR